MRSIRLQSGSLFPLLLASAVIVGYLPGLPAPFIFDDHDAIVTILPERQNKPAVTPRVVADMSFLVNYAISGLQPVDYRATNVAFHLLCGLLLFGVVRRTLNLPAFGGAYEQSAGPLALACAGLWAVHPIQTQAVTYVCQRFESMMGLFLMAMLYCFIRYASAGGERRGMWLCLSLAFCVLGMGTKEVMLTAPFLVLAYDALFLHQAGNNHVPCKWKFHALAFSACAIPFVLRALAAWHAEDSGAAQIARAFASVGLTPYEYLISQFAVIARYARLVFWPVGFCLDYAWPQTARLMDVLPHAAVLVGILTITCAGVAARRPLAYPFLWFFVTIAPTSSVIPINDLAVEHRMYMPSAGIAVAVVMLGYHGAKWLRRHGLPRYVLSAGMIVIMVVVSAALTWLTALRNRDYLSEEGMWRNVLSERPENLRALGNLSALAMGREDFAEAEALAKRVLSIVENPGAGHPESRFYFAHAHNILGILAASRESREEAEAHFNAAIESHPDLAEAYSNKASLLMQSGLHDDALRTAMKLLEMRPNDTGALVIAGEIMLARGDHRTAARYFDAAHSHGRHLPLVTYRLAWLLATSPHEEIRDPARALGLATDICEATGNANPMFLDALAAAQAACGNFSNAVETAETGLVLARSSEDPVTRDRLGSYIEARQALYRSGKPYLSAGEPRSAVSDAGEGAHP